VNNGNANGVGTQTENKRRNIKILIIPHKILNFDFINSLRYNKWV
jgi:hypothetical protein